MGDSRRSTTLFLSRDQFGEPPWRPHADVYRTSTGWLIKFDLAGVRPEDVEVKVWNRTLMVRGCRRDLTLEKGCRHHQLEIAYSRFERRIELPCELDAAKISCQHLDGMLLIQLRTESVKK